MPAWEWVAVIAVVIVYLVAEARARRWVIRRIVTSDGTRRSGTWQSAVADQYLRDATRLNADLDYFSWGIVMGTVPIWIAVSGYFSIGWLCLGLALSVFSFGAVGARAIYGDIRLKSIRSFYGRLIGWQRR
jgi:hypothetical protein